MIEPIVALVLISALVSALNPYTTGVLLLLASVIYGRGHDSGKVLRLGLAYITTLFSISVLGGVCLLWFMSILPLIALNYLFLGVGILIVCAGLLEIKDFFWYGQGMSQGIPRIAATNIRALSKDCPGPAMAVMLGLFVALIVAPHTSAPYFATITLLRGDFSVDAISLIILYSAMFCVPMIALLLAISSGVRVSTLIAWKEDSKGAMRLGVGLLLIALGWALILMANGVLNIG